MFRVYKCACVIKFHVAQIHLEKWHPIGDQIFVVVETSFIVSEEHHLDTCRPEFYYECNWNGARAL